MTKGPHTAAIASISPLCDGQDASRDAINAKVSALLAAQKPDPLRLTRHFKWLEYPNVTLPQGCWLLLGHDALQPPPHHGPSDASPSFLHKQLLNRLECEVAGKRLKPVRASRAAREDRFRLQDIAARSRDIGLAVSIAEELLDVARQMKIIKPSRADSLPRELPRDSNGIANS